MDLQITRARPEDWRRYREFRLLALQEAPAAFGSSHARELGFAESVWRQRLSENLSYLATDAGGQVVGAATGLALAEGELQVVAMYVAAAARRFGCATALLDVLARAGRDRGARRLVLDVTSGNTPAATCYARYGFVPTGRRRALERDPALVEIELAFDLGPAAAVEAGSVAGSI